MTFTVTRTIGIDAGHRVMTHGSKCRHLHGHRYGIEATCEAVGGRLHESGVQTDMVLDFGFLKEEMLAVIDEPCDHGFIVALSDVDLLAMLAPPDMAAAAWVAALVADVTREGFCTTSRCRLGTKVYVVPFQPTAERLARHWFDRLAERVAARSDGLARLVAVAVQETPNSRAVYAPGDGGMQAPQHAPDRP